MFNFIDELKLKDLLSTSYNEVDATYIKKAIRISSIVINQFISISEPEFLELDEGPKAHIERATALLADMYIKKSFWDDGQSEAESIGSLSTSITRNSKDFSIIRKELVLSGLFSEVDFIANYNTDTEIDSGIDTSDFVTKEVLDEKLANFKANVKNQEIDSQHIKDGAVSPVKLSADTNAIHTKLNEKITLNTQKINSEDYSVKDNSITEQKLTQKIRDVHNKHDDYENLHNSHIQRIDGNKNKIDVLENKYDAQGKLKLAYYQQSSGAPIIADNSIKSPKLSNSGSFDSGYPLRFNSQGDFNTFAIDEAHLTDAVKNKLNKAGSGSGGSNSPILKETSNDYTIQHPTILTEAYFAIAKSDGRMFIRRRGEGSCHVNDLMRMCDEYGLNSLNGGRLADSSIQEAKLAKTVRDKLFNEGDYFTQNADLLTSNSLISADNAKLGYGYRGNMFIGENASGGIFLAHNSKGSLSIGDNITGSVALGHNATGNIVIGSSKNTDRSKIVGGNGEAQFNEIIDMVRHEKDHRIEQQELVLWTELKGNPLAWKNIDWEKDLFTDNPLGYVNDAGGGEFNFNFSDDLPKLGAPNGILVFDFLLKTTTTANFDLYYMGHQGIITQKKQDGTNSSTKTWINDERILKDFDLSNEMRIKVELDINNDKKRVKVHSIRYPSIGATGIYRNWYEFDAVGNVIFKNADDDNFTISFELRRTSGNGYTTLEKGSIIKVYRMGTK